MNSVVAPLAVWLASAIAFTDQPTASPAPYTTADHMFPSENVRLSARLYAPNGQKHFPVVVLVAGSGNESVIGGVDTRVLATAFTKAGIGVLAYDKRGVGRSEGKFTGSDFKLLGADAAAAVRFAGRVNNGGQVGIWGISQAGWIMPYALATKCGATFDILVSPAGVNPYEQVEFFMHNQTRKWGLSEAEAQKAAAMHRATTLYYAGRCSYEKAQAVVESHRSAPWFKKVVSHPYWHKVAANGLLLTPSELAAEISKHPKEFELCRSESSFENYGRAYETLKLPTLVIYGANDRLVPIQESRAILESGLRRAGAVYQIKVFEGANHDIQTRNQVRQDYLDFMIAWIKTHL